MWIAELETRHYSWRAFGHSEAQARAAMERGWNIHRRRGGYRAEPFATFADDVVVYEAVAGVALQDGAEILTDAEQARKDAEWRREAEADPDLQPG